MKQAFVPFGNALRNLALRSSPGPRTLSKPVSAPPGFEPPEPIPDAQNGYARLISLTQNWPSEGHHAPDLKHRLKIGRADLQSAERALIPLRPILDRIDEALDLSLWQARITPDADWPELPRARRWGYALLLRGLVDGRSEDRDRAIELARRLRRAQGTMLHLVISASLEKQAEGGLQGIEDDRASAIHWNVARMAVPYAHLYGPWDPPLGVSTPGMNGQRQATRWALSGHPNAYDPSSKVALLLGEQTAMASGTAEELNHRLEAMGTPWPVWLWTPGVFSFKNGWRDDLHRARPLLKEIPNAFGRLSVAHTLYVAKGIAQMVERARSG